MKQILIIILVSTWLDAQLPLANHVQQKYFVTIPGCLVPGVTPPEGMVFGPVMAKTRIDAFSHIHATVWTEDEWEQAKVFLDKEKRDRKH